MAFKFPEYQKQDMSDLLLTLETGGKNRLEGDIFSVHSVTFLQVRTTPARRITFATRNPVAQGVLALVSDHLQKAEIQFLGSVLSASFV